MRTGEKVVSEATREFPALMRRLLERKVGAADAAKLFCRVDGTGTADKPEGGVTDKKPQMSAMDVRIQRYRMPGHDSGHLQPDMRREGGRLHPHVDSKQMGIVSLLSLGAPCKFLVDNKGTPTAPGCQLQTTSRCWCTNGQHWITEAMYQRQKEQRSSAGGGWGNSTPVSCPPGCCERCPRCKHIIFESGDVLMFDADQDRRIVHGLEKVLVQGEPEAAGAYFPTERLGGWVNPKSRYGMQFRYHNAHLMAEHHRDYAIGAISGYCYHGSRCPLIKALKTRYGALARQSDSDLASLEWGTFSRQRQASGGWGEASEKALQDKPPAVQEFLRLIERLAREREGGRFYQGSDRGNRLGLHDWIFHHFNP